MIATRNLLVALFAISFLFSCSKKKASCSDGIQNQNETRIDCGGPCSPCGTCSDGILNQDETNVDCGGVCSKCATCSDGIQNQNETGIDCGGPCGKCPIAYPKKGFYGDNLLIKGPDTSIINNGPYSIAANIPANSSVKVNIEWSSGNAWTINVGAQGNWKHKMYLNSFEYAADGPTSADAWIKLNYSGNWAKIKVYENGDTIPTWSKKISWW